MLWLFSNTAVQAVIVGGLSLYIFWYRRPKNFPPGPRGIPLLGAIPFLGSFKEGKFDSWAKEYGNVYSVRMGREDWIILNDFETIKKGFLIHATEFSNRSMLDVLKRVTGYNGLINLNYDDKCKTQKKFGYKALKGFEAVEDGIELITRTEVDFLAAVFESKKQKPFDMRNILSKATSNIVTTVIYGNRFEYMNPKADQLKKVLRLGFNTTEGGKIFQLLTLAPILENVPPFKNGVSKVVKELKFIVEFFQNLIKERKQNFDPDNAQSFVDLYLIEMEKGEEYFTEKQLATFIRDMYAGSSETICNTIRWAILCMLHQPNTQKKMFNEIKQVLGLGGKATYSRRGEMPYTCAFIQELLRFRTMVSLGVPHIASVDAVFEGYNIPKGTKILANLWAVHNNPKVWSEPDQFRPERHINKDGEFIKSEQIVTFSIGARQCMGEKIARMTIFVFLVSLVQRFRFLPDPNVSELPTLKLGNPDIVTSPFDYDAVAEAR